MAYEIAHLHGILCLDRLTPGGRPIPVEHYRGTGTGWQFPERGAIR